MTTKNKTTWKASDLTVQTEKPGIIEFQDNSGEWHDFSLCFTPEKIVFGGVCNAGFLESGFIFRDEGETTNETLQELISDLETFYNDGASYISRILHNERM